MGIEEEAKPESCKTTPSILPPGNLSSNEIVAGLGKAEAELVSTEAKLKALETEEKTFEWAKEYADVEHANQDLSKLSDEMLQQQSEVLAEQVEQAQKRVETNRRALKLGLLKKANQAPRCSHVKDNGDPCRAPAKGGEVLCVFHARAAKTEEGPTLKVEVLENPEGVQIAVKQIMERVVGKSIDQRDAALLLRAVQIVGSTFKSNKPGSSKRKPVRRESSEASGNAEEIVG